MKKGDLVRSVFDPEYKGMIVKVHRNDLYDVLFDGNRLDKHVMGKMIFPVDGQMTLDQMRFAMDIKLGGKI